MSTRQAAETLLAREIGISESRVRTMRRRLMGGAVKRQLGGRGCTAEGSPRDVAAIIVAALDPRDNALLSAASLDQMAVAKVAAMLEGRRPVEAVRVNLPRKLHVVSASFTIQAPLIARVAEMTKEAA